MALVQVNGSAVTKTSTDNNGGIIKGGGNIANTALWTSKGLGCPVSLAAFGGDSIISGVGTTGILPTVAFGVNLAQGIIERSTTVIADVSNTLLLGGASEMRYASGIVPVETRYTINITSGIRHGNWNEFSGVFSPALKTRYDSFGADHAARSTRGRPGEWAFLQGSILPRTGDYSPKTGG